MTPAEKHKRADDLRTYLDSLNSLATRLVSADEVTLSKSGYGREIILIPPLEGASEPAEGPHPHLVVSFTEVTREYKERLLRHLRTAREAAEAEYTALFSTD
ncbi:MAG: hypothetical protein ACRYFX_18885 [Janthinobacterium lividum]